ncbi:MAG: hypothetical protein ACNS63_12115 [Candidatus Nitrospinota bacterium M3_3B_026]
MTDAPRRGKTDDEAALRAMEEAARKLGLEVEYKSLGDDEIDVASGACRVKDRRLLIVDSRLPAALRVKAMARVLRNMETETVYLPPLAREIMESA